MVKLLKQKNVLNLYPDLICTGIATIKDLERGKSKKEKELLKHLFEQRGISSLQIKSLSELCPLETRWLKKLEEDQEKIVSCAVSPTHKNFVVFIFICN